MNAWLESLTGLLFQDPWALAAALLLAPAWYWGGRRGQPTVLFAPAAVVPGGLASLPRTARVRWVRLPRGLALLALLCAFVALARPVARVALPAESLGLDILLCLDVSSSMTERDMDREATRLEVARDAAARFVADRPDDRIGLLVFARYPDLRCPPTRDHAALLEFLDELQVVEPDGPEDATGVGTAVARAAEVLGGLEVGSRVAVLLTDGEENVATAQTPEEIAPFEAAQLAASLGVRVYTIAAGEGRRAADGSWRELDTGPVRRLAERTGGAFFAARDAAAVAGVYATIDELEPTTYAEPRFTTEERYAGFVWSALVLAGLALLVRHGPLRRLP